jgi:hypothetical protein
MTRADLGWLAFAVAVSMALWLIGWALVAYPATYLLPLS